MILYRLLLSFALPVGLGLAAYKVFRGSTRLNDVYERFGANLPPQQKKTVPVLWIHGASNGEIICARPLIQNLRTRIPNVKIIVTVNSVSARNLVRSWDNPDVSVRLAPVDLRRTTAQFLTKFQPDALLTLENEIWPNRFTLCAQRNIPVIVAGARMSENAARTWHKCKVLLQSTMQSSFAAITGLAAQDQASKKRFVDLGLKASTAQLLPQMNLKSGVSLDPTTVHDATELRAAFTRNRTILAASTHEGEDGPILAAFSQVKQNYAEAKLILAPRHPARAQVIEAQAREAGLSVARRSRAEAAHDCDVYLADTLGEMAQWYSLAGYTFVGGSLVEKGGHTPFEPAQFGSTILHGPHVSNNTAAFDALLAAEGAIPVHDADTLTTALMKLLSDPQRAEVIAATGAAALMELRKFETASPEFWELLVYSLKKHS